MSSQKSKDEIDRHITQIISEKKPENVEQLIELMQDKFALAKTKILSRILALQEKGKIRLKPNQTFTQKSKSFIRSSQAAWYWATLITTLTTAIIVFIIPENASPLVYARYILGSIFVLWLPGYTFIKALFPSKNDLDPIERVALSIGLSLALVPIVGLLLNYSPWGITPTPITISLLALTITLATLALIREHQTRTPTKIRPEAQS